jgi:hypothetical protein
MPTSDANRHVLARGNANLMRRQLKIRVVTAVALGAAAIFLGPGLYHFAHAQTAAPSEGKVTSAQTAPSSTPNLGGVWRRSRRPPDNKHKYTIFQLALSLTNDNPPMTPWAEAKFKAAKPNLGPTAVPLAESNDPVINCFPPGVPRIYLQRGGPFEIIQIPGRVLMVFEYDHFIRQIYTDGRAHPKDEIPTWMGDSVGKWEGDTLVVDTVGFNDNTWLDNVGHPHSDQLHLIERIRRVDHNTLTIDLTIDDPKAYTKPWSARQVFELKPTWNIGEMICEDNVTFSDMQKKAEAGK